MLNSLNISIKIYSKFRQPVQIYNSNLSETTNTQAEALQIQHLIAVKYFWRISNRRRSSMSISKGTTLKVGTSIHHINNEYGHHRNVTILVVMTSFEVNTTS